MKNNGSDKKGAAKAADEAKGKAARPGAARNARFAQSFANIIAVLMRDPGFRTLRIADLEWLVLPAIMSGQWRIAQATVESAQPAPAGGQKSSFVVPAAIALWARVSPAVDARLSSDLDKPLALKPNEWMSGDIHWLIAVAGDKRVVPKFVETLMKDVFKDKPVKSRVMGSDGKVVVRTQGKTT